jgi:hypothetical protein
MKKRVVETVLEQTLMDLCPESVTARLYFRGEIAAGLLRDAFMRYSEYYFLSSRLSLGVWLRLRIKREIDIWEGGENMWLTRPQTPPSFRVWLRQLIKEKSQRWLGLKNEWLTIQEVALPFRHWLVALFKEYKVRMSHRALLPRMDEAIPGVPTSPTVDDDSKKKHEKEKPK